MLREFLFLQVASLRKDADRGDGDSSQAQDLVSERQYLGDLETEESPLVFFELKSVQVTHETYPHHAEAHVLLHRQDEQEEHRAGLQSGHRRERDCGHEDNNHDGHLSQSGNPDACLGEAP